MIDPKTIADTLVSRLKEITALVTAMGGSASNITAYHDSFPKASQLWEAINELKPPAMLVVWNGTMPAGGRMELWMHEFALIVRAKPETTTATGYTDIWLALCNGVPTGGDRQRLIFSTIVAGLHRMETPSIRRMSIPVNERDALDYFEITIRFTEAGS
jgi:hypothetical protein